MSPGSKKNKSVGRLVEGGPPAMDRRQLMMQQDDSSSQQYSGRVATGSTNKKEAAAPTPKSGSWSSFRALLGGKKKEKRGSREVSMLETGNKCFAGSSTTEMHIPPTKTASKLALLKFRKTSKPSAGHSEVKDFGTNDDSNFEFSMPGRISDRLSGRVKKTSGGSVLKKRVTESSVPVVTPSKEQVGNMLDFSNPLKRNLAQGKPLMGTTRTVTDGYEEISTIKPKAVHGPGPPKSAPPTHHFSGETEALTSKYNSTKRNGGGKVTQIAAPRAIMEQGEQNEVRSTKNASGRFQTAGLITAQSVGVRGANESSHNLPTGVIGDDANLSVNERLKLRARNGFKVR